MIAIFCRRWQQAQLIARHLTSATGEVDGPFRLFKGRFQGEIARVFATGTGMDASYAAARLAVMRGAESLLSVYEAEVGFSALEELGLHAGEPVSPSYVFDLTSLEPLLWLLPDSADRFPMELAEVLPEGPVWKREEHGPALGSARRLLRNPYLMAELRARKHIALIDRETAGVADAAREHGKRFYPVSIPAAVVTESGLAEPVGFEQERNFDAAVEQLLRK